jgi:hypothetical protein
MRSIFFLLILMIVLIYTGCSNMTSPPPGPLQVFQLDNKIFIKDLTGKDWDVTHAVEQYHFNAGGFQYGLGPNAIRPILNPVLLSPEQAGFPNASNTFLVIGIEVNGDARAYPISILTDHEVANDRFGKTSANSQTAVAVAY